MTRPPVPRRPMSIDEQRMGEALGLCRVLPASFDKRFAAEMAACARDDAPAITEKQAECLCRLVHKYRRQIPADVVALAGARPPDPWTVPVAAAPAPPPAEPSPFVTPAPASPQLSLL
jgi:hypothetical protein